METLDAPTNKRKTLKDETPAKVEVNDVVPDDLVVLTFVGAMDRADEAVRKANKARSAVRKAAINAGIVMKEFQEMREEAKLEPEAVIARYVRRQRYAEIMGVPTGHQFDLLKPKSAIAETFDERRQKARTSGLARGATGGFPDEQAYPPGHEFHQEHMDGWHEGQGELLKLIQQLPLVENEGKLVEEPGEDG